MKKIIKLAGVSLLMLNLFVLTSSADSSDLELEGGGSGGSGGQICYSTVQPKGWFFNVSTLVCQGEGACTREIVKNPNDKGKC